MRKNSKRKQSERNSSIRKSSGHVCLIGDRDLQDIREIKSYPNVKIGIWNLPTTKKFVAIKTLKEVQITEELDDLLQGICKLDGHEHVHAFYGICLRENVIKLVTEYARFGSLFDVMRDSELKYFFCQHTRLKKLAIQICNGMTYISDKGLVHGNLTSTNVLVVDEDLVRIADVGLARTLNRGRPITEDNAGCAIEWWAPEILRDGQFTNKSDIYSYGVLLKQMMTFGEEPWKPINKDKIVEHRIAYPFEKPKNPIRCCHSEIVDLMNDCWKNEPADRPNFDEIACLLEKITYSVGSTTVMKTDFSPEGFSYGVNSRMTLIERLDDTQWLAQNDEAIVGIIRKDMINLKRIPQERQLPTQISRPFNPIRESSLKLTTKDNVHADASEGEGNGWMSNLIDLPCVAQRDYNAQGFQENKRSVIEGKGDAVDGCQSPPRVPPRSDLIDGRPYPKPTAKHNSISDYKINSGTIEMSNYRPRCQSDPSGKLDDIFNRAARIESCHSGFGETGSSSMKKLEKMTPNNDEDRESDDQMGKRGVLDEGAPLIDFFADPIVINPCPVVHPQFDASRGLQCGEVINKNGSPPVEKDLAHCDKKDNDDDLLIDLFTSMPNVPSSSKSVPNSNYQDDKDHTQKEGFPLVDLSKNSKQLSKTRTFLKENKEKQNNERDEQGSSELLNERLRVSTVFQDKATFGERVQTPSMPSESNGDCARDPDVQEEIYQVPFHIPIPDYVPYVDPERLRQPPPAKQKDIAYGGETNSLIVRLQREYPDKSRDECYALLVAYNCDIETIISILIVKSLTGLDEKSAQYHLKHCNWNVERAVDYIFSKSD